MGVGDGGEEWVWIVWRDWWNGGDCDVGLYDGSGSHIPRGCSPSQDLVAAVGCAVKVFSAWGASIVCNKTLLLGVADAKNNKG